MPVRYSCAGQCAREHPALQQRTEHPALLCYGLTSPCAGREEPSRVCTRSMEVGSGTCHCKPPRAHCRNAKFREENESMFITFWLAVAASPDCCSPCFLSFLCSSFTIGMGEDPISWQARTHRISSDLRSWLKLRIGPSARFGLAFQASDLR